MKYFTADEVAKKLNISRNHVYSLIKQGELEKVQGLGKTIRIPETSLKKLLDHDVFKGFENKIEILNTHLGNIRKIKETNEYILKDICQALQLNSTHVIKKCIDNVNTRLLKINELKELGIEVVNTGILVINAAGLKQYSLKSLRNIDWNKFLNELNINKSYINSEKDNLLLEQMQIFKEENNKEEYTTNPISYEVNKPICNTNDYFNLFSDDVKKSMISDLKKCNNKFQQSINNNCILIDKLESSLNN